MIAPEQLDDVLSSSNARQGVRESDVHELSLISSSRSSLTFSSSLSPEASAPSCCLHLVCCCCWPLSKKKNGVLPNFKTKMLVHLTKARPKGPVPRLLPSQYQFSQSHLTMTMREMSCAKTKSALPKSKETTTTDELVRSPQEQEDLKSVKPSPVVAVAGSPPQ